MDCQTLKELILSNEWAEIPEIVILSVKETYNILISIQSELRAKAERTELSAVLEDVAKIIDRRYDSSLQMTSGIQREQGLDRVQLQQVRTLIQTAFQRKTLKMQTGESPKLGVRTQYMGNALLEQIEQIEERSLQKHGELLIQIENLRNQFGSITTNLTNQLEEQLARYQKDLQQLRQSHDEEITRQAQLIKELKRENLRKSSKVDSRGSQSEYLQSVISTLRSQIEQINVKKVQRKQISELRSRMAQLQEEKSQSSRQYEKILQSIEQSRVGQNEKFKKLRSQIRSQFTKGLKDTLKTLRQEFKSSSSREVSHPVREPREAKVNESMSISKKQSKSAINDIKQSLRRVQQQLSVRKQKPNQNTEWLEKKLAQQDQKLQNYIKHVCQLIDQKPQSQPVSLSLLQLHQLLRLTSSNSLLAHEFVWKSVVHNTNHDNYKLQNNRQTVFVLTPGLYRVSVAVFTLMPNQFHVILNNQCIISSQFTKESARRTGCVRGNQVSELVVLPSRCRLSVSYKGPEEYQSFFQLERL